MRKLYSFLLHNQYLLSVSALVKIPDCLISFSFLLDLATLTTKITSITSHNSFYTFQVGFCQCFNMSSGSSSWLLWGKRRSNLSLFLGWMESPGIYWESSKVILKGYSVQFISLCFIYDSFKWAKFNSWDWTALEIRTIWACLNKVRGWFLKEICYN